MKYPAKIKVILFFIEFKKPMQCQIRDSLNISNKKYDLVIFAKELWPNPDCVFKFSLQMGSQIQLFAFFLAEKNNVVYANYTNRYNCEEKTV